MTAAVVAATGASYIAGANRSLSFASASSQRLSMSDANFGAYDTDKFSIAFWLKADTSGGAILCQGDGTASSGAFELGMNSTRMEFVYYNGSNYGYFTSTTTGWTGDWNHVVIHADLANATSSDRIKMWVNGAAETAYGYSAPYTSLNNSSLDVKIGQNNSYGYYNGKLYQLAFFNDTLVTASTIYNSGVPLDIRGYSGLYSYIHTNDPNITDDYVLATDWINTNSVTLSTDIPT